ncbi:ribosomal protein S18-alanine N-acetyltransferase [Symbiobacterium thermophilum]|uniref:Ribosomal-protein-alanine N-acetyltransferase n=1 Tax=Symbiobacterium thermophilum TaxID=2734 RepID=A0A953LHN8_SYMTR|nr:ribosomal protein S18-alanine N-acetyltransferase [Symbiobacterium thermophilum]MBY6275149.1 ribosomal-protein-alanine N-acetyltransferase [Symbiobacterium thermophilum]
MGVPEIAVHPMTLADLDQVMEVERLSYLTPWSRQAFESELLQRYTVYLVARAGERVVGFAGMHVLWEMAHVTNVAVHPEFRGRGIGERLMRELIRIAYRRGAVRMTLEVRVGNFPAQALYRKLGFVTEPGAVRKGYYTDTGEDAIIMWKEPLVEEAI